MLGRDKVGKPAGYRTDDVAPAGQTQAVGLDRAVADPDAPGVPVISRARRHRIGREEQHRCHRR
ncbi:MAG: hypothetical protein MZV65_17905 [Chromatiales bacterium]|nr:hypothetical protein [Chromatiales bacterium]